jgi:1,6-anhydro-N-acetylmuramate kinase
MSELFLGLISGTSADGIDAALVRFEPSLEILAANTVAYPALVRERLLALTAADATISLDAYGALDTAVGECFADAALALLGQAGVSRSAVRAVGSHGQTVRHQPLGRYPFSLQIGDAAVIAERTGICTVADFRRADIAAGGQGAPLAPAFHAYAFAESSPCAALNLGGIANLSLLDSSRDILGFDTGPANCLLDAWNARHQGTPCDIDGAWAESGAVDMDLLDSLLDDDYFRALPPKSTGREYFNQACRCPGNTVGVDDEQYCRCIDEDRIEPWGCLCLWRWRSQPGPDVGTVEGSPASTIGEHLGGRHRSGFRRSRLVCMAGMAANCRATRQSLFGHRCPQTLHAWRRPRRP